MKVLVYTKNLDEKVRLDIANRKFSEAELENVRDAVKAGYLKGKKTRAVVMAVIAAVLGILTFIFVKDMKDTTFAVIISVLMVLMWLEILWLLNITIFCRARNQFIKAVKKGYPELADEIRRGL